MADFIILMHDDASGAADDWGPYIARLQASGHFQGGSAIGSGLCVRRDGRARPVTAHLTGYLRVDAASVDEVATLLEGNPHFESGGTVEIRELPRDE